MYVFFFFLFIFLLTSYAVIVLESKKKKVDHRNCTESSFVYLQAAALIPYLFLFLLLPSFNRKDKRKDSI